MIRNGIISAPITVALLLTIQFANGGQISDEFPEDSVLTSAKMENIKSEVNNNDNRISTNTDDITALETNKSVSVHDRTNCSLLITNDCTDTLTTTVSEVTKVEIDAPSPGKVLVSFSGQYQVAHTVGTSDAFCIEIDTSATAAPYPNCDGQRTIRNFSIDASHRAITIPADVTTRFHQGGVHSQQVFTVTTGTHTYYLRGQSNSTGINISLRQSNMIAQFIPD